MTTPSNTGVVFIARRSALEPCLRWRLTEDALLCERGPAPDTLLSRLLGSPADDWPERIRFEEIRSIRAYFDPTRFAANRYRCDLLSESGARTSIFSTHYAGPGRFDDRGDQYAAFVGNLVLRVQTNRPSVELNSGLPWPSYLLQHGLMLASLVALATVLGIAGVAMFEQFWVKLAIIFAYVGVALRSAWINAPRTSVLPSQSENETPAAKR